MHRACDFGTEVLFNLAENLDAFFLLIYNLFKHGKIYSSYKKDNKLILILNKYTGLQDCRVGARLFIKILIKSFFKFILCLKLSYFLRKAVPQ